MKVSDYLARIGKYAYNTVRGNVENKDARKALQNMSLPLEQQNQTQYKLLKEIITQAYDHSPLYRRRFREISFEPGDFKSISDIKQLPILTKDDIHNNLEDILCDNAGPDDRIKSITGGTTGIPVTFYRDRYSQSFRWGIDMAIARYYGWKDGQWQGWLWGATRDLIESKSIKEKITQHWVYRVYVLDTLRLTDKVFEQFVQKTKKYHPPFILAYPSLAYDLAERIKSGAVSPVKVPVISVTAEPLHDFQRKSIESFLADKVYARYGAREFGTVAFECPEQEGMHIITESVYLEVLPETNDSQTGTVLVTDLLNKTMPLIRYRIGDIAALDESPCSCGLTSPRLCGVVGRETDIIWRPDGSGVSGTAIIALFANSGLRTKVQVIQEQLDDIVVRIEGTLEDNQPEVERLLASFRQEIGSDINYRVEPVEKIKRTPSGKYRYVISNVKQSETKN